MKPHNLILCGLYYLDNRRKINPVLQTV